MLYLFNIIYKKRWRLSSSGERFLHTEEIVGSITIDGTKKC